MTNVITSYKQSLLKVYLFTFALSYNKKKVKKSIWLSFWAFIIFYTYSELARSQIAHQQNIKIGVKAVFAPSDLFRRMVNDLNVHYNEAPCLGVGLGVEYQYKPQPGGIFFRGELNFQSVYQLTSTYNFTGADSTLAFFEGVTGEVAGRNTKKIESGAIGWVGAEISALYAIRIKKLGKPRLLNLGFSVGYGTAVYFNLDITRVMKANKSYVLSDFRSHDIAFLSLAPSIEYQFYLNRTTSISLDLSLQRQLKIYNQSRSLNLITMGVALIKII